MDSFFTSNPKFDDDGLLNLPSTWFKPEITLEQIRARFSKAETEIRIASGFFTIKGWGLIRPHIKAKQVYLLVGIDEPGEERARAALIKEIMRHLATGHDEGRRKSVEDLIARMKRGKVHIVDARASSHHGKLYIIDRHTAINTSANTTGRGFLEQIESGNVLAPSEDKRFVLEHGNSPGVGATSEMFSVLKKYREKQIAEWIKSFDEYFATATDITQKLLTELEEWLRFALPWDVYLKTLLALEQIQPLKTCYDKQPVSYQQDMIAQTLRQIKAHGGSMLVASTGLGKTVMGTHIALQLKEEDLIDNVMVISPKPVRESWQDEMRDAGLSLSCFTLHTLDTKEISRAKELRNWQKISKHISSSRARYLLIIDESHQLRNQYTDEFANRLFSGKTRKERLAFTRITELVNLVAERKRVKVLLLSGSPYAKDIDNINVQLALLPHTNKSNEVEFNPWKINEAEEFRNLSVANQLTSPFVAKNFGISDRQGLYINFGKSKRYFPDIILYSISYILPCQSQIVSAIRGNCFDINTGYCKNIENLVKKVWASSPLALRRFLEQVVDTPGGVKELPMAKKEKSRFILDKSQRQSIINPIINQLKNIKAQDDLKLQNLLKLLEFHCIQNQEKVIVFCEQLATVYYLDKVLKNLLTSLKVYGTIYQTPSRPRKEVKIKYSSKSDSDIISAIAAFAPVANDAVGDYDYTYDVFITTDAFGIGVNMQDASVAVNYDIAWTSIEPIQRAGRILRLWREPRTVKLYTFVPTFNTQNFLQGEEIKLNSRWENLMLRHEESRKFTDLPVLTEEEILGVNLPDFAPNTTVKQGKLNLESVRDEEVSPYYSHTRKLHPHREYAMGLRNDLTSALVYSGNTALIYVLLNYRNQPHLLLYNPKTKELRSPAPEYILHLIECNSNTETALVDGNLIEDESDTCIRLWCEANEVSSDEVLRQCTLYLKPKEENDTFQ